MITSFQLPITNYQSSNNYQLPITNEKTFGSCRIRSLKIENCEMKIGVTGGSD